MMTDLNLKTVVGAMFFARKVRLIQIAAKNNALPSYLRFIGDELDVIEKEIERMTKEPFNHYDVDIDEIKDKSTSIQYVMLFSGTIASWVKDDS